MKWILRLWAGLPILMIVFFGHIWLTHTAIFQPVAQISFLNLDQGDATLLQTDKGQRVLVDCGDIDGPILSRLQDSLGFLARRIDVLIVTHSHRDHYGGCFDVIDQYTVGAVMINGIRKEEGSLYEDFLAEVSRREIQILPGLAGTEISLEEYRLEVLHPTNEQWGEVVANDNDISVVVAGFGKTSNVLLMGDTYISGESQIIKRYPDLDIDVLKVGHHGSNTSTSQQLLDHISAHTAIISAGKDNRHGHPHQEVVERLDTNNIQIKETQHLKSIDIFW